MTDIGFTASWRVTHLNRSFPQVWAGKNYVPSDDAFGVDLIMESDHYTKAERSAKYGLLFITLTFLLAMKDYAFLAGNIGLFVLLAVLMLVSAKYRLFRE